MTASSLSFRIAVVCALAGIGMGIAMGISRDHSIMPAHAHLNLLGWVSLFLFGIYYRLHPTIDASPLARIQVWIWSIATLVLTVAVAAIHMGYTGADPVAAVSSLVVLGAMVLFGILVFLPSFAERWSMKPALTPAE
jgi:hypothetical protein